MGPIEISTHPIYCGAGLRGSLRYLRVSAILTRIEGGEHSFPKEPFTYLSRGGDLQARQQGARGAKNIRGGFIPTTFYSATHQLKQFRGTLRAKIFWGATPGSKS